GAVGQGTAPLSPSPTRAGPPRRPRPPFPRPAIPQPPVDKQLRLPARHFGEPATTAAFVPSQRLVLPTRPAGEGQVKMSADCPYGGRGETPVVLPPPRQAGVGGSREGAKILARLAGQRPLGDRRPHRLLGRAARSGQAAHQEFAGSVLRPSGPERKAQKGALHRRILAPTIAGLAGDNPRLVRVH